MIKKIISLSVLVWMVCLAQPSIAQTTYSNEYINNINSAQGKGGSLGLGLNIGNPVGPSLKLFLSPTTALEVVAGFPLIGADGFSFRATHLWYPGMLTQTNHFKLPWYVGIGAFVAAGDDRDNVYSTNDNNGDVSLGGRVPIGLSFAFTRVALEAYIEMGAGIEVIDDPGFQLDSSIGVRYMF